MLVPGSNLLSMALSVIGSSPVMYYTQTGRAQAANGEWVAQFAAGVIISQISVQAIDRLIYADLDLDYQKNYVRIYVPKSLQDLQRDKSGDRFGFGGRKFQIQSDTDWFKMDSWTGAICVDIGVDTGIGA